MKTATTIQENAEDILEDAKQINDELEQEQIFEDCSSKAMQKMRSKPLKRSENRPKKKANRR